MAMSNEEIAGQMVAAYLAALQSSVLPLGEDGTRLGKGIADMFREVVAVVNQ